MVPQFLTNRRAEKHSLATADAQPTTRPSPSSPVVPVTQGIWNKMAIPLFLLAALALAFRMASGTNHHQNGTAKPNFIFIMTDDQDLHLNSLEYQNIVQEQLIKKGTTFKKHFCTVALCCPSRVSLLTGKAAHNTNVTDVSWPYGGYTKFATQGLNEAYLPVWLQSYGYNTYYTGKLMNQHSTRTYNQPFAKGWTRSDFLLDPGTYSYLDGIMALDKNEYRSIKGQYSTDVIANRSLEFLDNALAAGKPFFLGVTPIGPHANTGFTTPIPADRHKHLFPNVSIPRSPSFNPSTPGHVNYLKNLPQLTSTQIQYSDNFYRARLQTLQAVDELVGGIIDVLEKVPEVLANTYIIYTSDNGYHIGQHRLPPGKTCNIEEDINVPFIIRGPGIAAGKEVSFPTSHTDIVPTLFKLAGIPLHEDFDGVPIAVTPEDQRRQVRKNEHVNIEYWGRGYLEGEVFGNLRGAFSNNTYKTLRLVGDKHDFMYGVWCTNEHQLYDMKTDPHQMTNLYGSKEETSGYDIPALSARLDALLLTLKSCKGKVCREPWKTLFPDPRDNVRSLDDAMDTKYDDFFFNQQKKVTFSECVNGYITEYEGALEPVGYVDWDRYLAQNRWSDET
ncbi:arylsulfatase precursor [Metarhizium guizhouense ARSEF 977]|uniref:Arylsulfatase n=1 Tax=Metarhizium guizhouense (strain ARSEF 977) TaxID=1276136 RepID=A0A0B4GZ98_METGA|nr:arylsulfatase precursor [Metarhizium guizhouense ARSEF 977]